MDEEFKNELIERISRLEAKIDNLVEPEVGGIWTNWTPTIDQGGAVTVTVTYAEYTIILDTVLTNVLLAVTSAGIAGNAIRIGNVPTTIQPTGAAVEFVIGNGMVVDTFTARYQGALIAGAVSTWVIQPHATSASGIGASPNFALASGDIISFQAAYER